MSGPGSGAGPDRSGAGAKVWVWAGVTAALTCVLYGYSSGIVAGAQLFYVPHFGLSTTQQSFAVSSFLLGAALSALTSGRISDRIGRRRILLLSGLLFGVGLLACALAPGFALFLAGRIVQGLAAGIASALVPVYLSEISDARNRGRMGLLNQLGLTLGLLLSYVVALVLSASGDWRWMFGAGAVGVVLFLLLSPTLRESPAWHHKRRVADRTGSADDEGRASVTDLFTSAVRPALITGAALCALQQLCGINAVLYFAPTIIKTTGLSASNSILYSVFIGALNLLMTFVSARLVDRWGRRPLLLLSVGGMFVTLVPLGACFVWDVSGQSVIALVCLLGYVAFFAIGAGPVIWLLVSELFPPRVRARGASLCTAVNWVCNFLVNQFFLHLVQSLGEGQTFWLFAALCLLGLVFIARKVPETRGRTDAEIADAVHRL
ncbi:sugar porter family MFS transporter [Streptomyces sp. UH6]|uniref:sugar porter family MFS transporter n=1 Tax=Streptomyces sp. UH6 TaxID=2748379 RepID=UPI0015D48225|nr:sugar porter family MFS transporter [Streptomyces sp. UH6]NYV72892.1 sugar porter family MFS transporter [Streptomyces sp. UH6]